MLQRKRQIQWRGKVSKSGKLHLVLRHISGPLLKYKNVLFLLERPTLTHLVWLPRDHFQSLGCWRL
jgi:hypothetical protein